MQTTVEERPSVSEAKPPTYAGKLRQLADWIDANEIGDRAIIHCGVEIGGGPVLVTRDHDVLRVCFPGRRATVRCTSEVETLILTENGIRFEGWKFQNNRQEPVELRL